MCGIAGIQGENVADKLYKMLVTLRHRGPDVSGVFVDGKVIYGDLDSLNVPEGSFGLGHNLFSILGSEGLQPIVHDNFVLICDGEIYNFQELKEYIKDDFKTDFDFEVIISLIRNFYNGSLFDAVVKTVEYLDGDYAFAIYDGQNLAVIRDPVGVKPVYFGESDDKKIFAFASERKALWNISINEVEALPPKSILYNKTVLELGDRLKIQNIDFNISNKFETDTMTKLYHTSLETLKNQLKGYLITSVKNRIKGLRKVGLIFSGGIDSTILAKIADGLDAETILYCVGDEKSIDIRYAKKAARDMRLPLHIKTVNVQDVREYMPLVLNAIEEFNVMKIGVGMPAFIASQMAHEDGLKVMLSGQGADELFGGYHRYLKLYQKKGEATGEDLRKDILSLYHVNLQRDDAVTMANSVELRVPYLDLDIINMAMNIPMKYKIKDENDNLRKHILRKIGVDLEVPLNIVKRPKKAAQYGSGIHKMLIKILKNNL